jgi:light-regulated signal transduction histidine kinase (bacteriophytochrome)
MKSREEGASMTPSTTLATSTAAQEDQHLSGRRQRITASESPAEQAERAAEELEQLRHAVSHDLSQPLTTITGFADLLVRRYGESLDADGREFLSFITGAALRMRGMIDDLSSYIRVGQGGHASGEVDVSRVLDAVRDSLGSELAEAGAELTADELPTVFGDAVEIGQVFLNVASNALKFRKCEPPHVHVSAVREGRFVRFSVADNGIGIDPDGAERAFELFQRLHPAGEYPGTGAGLAIVRRIVECHGGTIWAERRPEGGTTVHFTLPAARSAA